MNNKYLVSSVYFTLLLIPLISELNYKAQIVAALFFFLPCIIYSPSGNSDVTGKSTDWGRVLVFLFWGMTAWSAVALIWSEAGIGASSRVFKQSGISILLTALWYRHWGRDFFGLIPRETLTVILSAGLVLGASVFLFGHYSLSRTTGGEGPFLASLALFLIVSLPLLWKVKTHRLWGAVVCGICLFAIFTATNLSAQAALFAAICVYVLALFVPRITITLVALGSLVLVTAPVSYCVIGPEAFASLSPTSWIENYADIALSIRHRMEIYSFALEMGCQQFWFGWGVGSTAFIPGGQQSVAGLGKLLPSHSHNMPIHVMLETGAAGLTFVMAIVATLFVVIYRTINNRHVFAAGLGLMVCYLTIASLSYSAWASWFQITGIFAVLVLNLGQKSQTSSERRKLLFLVTEDWYFMSHRLPMAEAAREMGYEVSVACRSVSHGAAIEKAGYTLHRLKFFKRNHKFAVMELLSCAEILWLYLRLSPSVVIHVAIKQVLFGSGASLFIPGIRVINLIAGLGTVFSNDQIKYKLLRQVILGVLRLVHWMKPGGIVVQNKDNRHYLIEQKVAPQTRVFLLPGSGVNTDIHREKPVANFATPAVVAMAGRVLWSKGVGVFVEASKILAKQGIQVQMRVIGSPDQANKDFVPEEQLQAWHDSGLIEWQAHRDDMMEAWQETDIAVFPTFYGEGIPLALLEAAATGLPIIASDIAGCRDLIVNDQTGLLIETQNAEVLAEAIASLLSDPDKARRLSQAVRDEIIKGYSAKQITIETRKILMQICP